MRLEITSAITPPKHGVSALLGPSLADEHLLKLQLQY